MCDYAKPITFIDTYGGRPYDKTTAEGQRIYEQGRQAGAEFARIVGKNIPDGFSINGRRTGRNWLSGDRRHVRNYLWGEYRKTDYMSQPINISIAVRRGLDTNVEYSVALALETENSYIGDVLENYRSFLMNTSIPGGFQLYSSNYGGNATIVGKEDIKKMGLEDLKHCEISIFVDGNDRECGTRIKSAIEEVKKLYKELLDGDECGLKIDNVTKYLDAILSHNKQIVLTGAPGTGKTYSVIEYVKKQTGNDETRYKFVQFHPSYDYSDFVEGIRPIDDSACMKFVKIDGIFKEFCRDIVKENWENAYSTSKPYDAGNFESEIKNHKVEEHNDTDKEDNTQTEGQESEWIRFDEGLDEGDSEKKYYFVIDEINRADLSKVFGELMFGLEESYRGVKNRFPTQYKNLSTFDISSGTTITFDCFKEGFFIPKNLYIIGTMNNIDKSVEAFDFALRRRFKWKDIEANAVMRDVLNSFQTNGLIGASINVDKLVKKAIAMNNVVSDEGKRLGLNKDYHIGPAYYKGIQDLSTIEDFFENNIRGILEEYTRGRESSNFIDNCKKALRDTV